MTTEKCHSVCLLVYDIIFFSPKNRPWALIAWFIQVFLDTATYFLGRRHIRPHRWMFYQKYLFFPSQLKKYEEISPYFSLSEMEKIVKISILLGKIAKICKFRGKNWKKFPIFFTFRSGKLSKIALYWEEIVKISIIWGENCQNMHLLGFKLQKFANLGVKIEKLHFIGKKV